MNSFDPNDITVLEGEETYINDIDKYLHYIIRFQNAGTSEAINLKGTNILDDKLDWNTLELKSSSHDNRVEINNGNTISFIFNYINLPDSTLDDPNSHGYIAYKVKPKSNVIVDDVF
ncbi:DUF7619 domain-containing protein [Psychroserpens jangbogonensis]|uniref:DUF7619 domain-containing protein n=1 Tax=Psychroserpens jangbogonensis TaxID=1484460 RepID=UPI00053D44C6|nr:hypothetical protein [Psychroserpens jangbogonensis]